MTTEEKIQFREDYMNAKNAATGSKYDQNSNVTNQNIATLSWEIPKKDNIDINRQLMKNKIEELYDNELALQYVTDLKNHIIYKHDETSLIHDYCMSISMYPFLLDGLNSIGGTSDAPKHLKSFCGSFINLCFIGASELAGALATIEWLPYFDHFARLDYGQDYYLRLDEVANKFTGETIKDILEGYFQQVVFTINQPAAARGAQSIFWNISYFDKYFFAGLFEGFVFPDGDAPCWESVSILQKLFIRWLNAERLKKVLTFPVETINLIDDGKGNYKDEETADFIAQVLSEGHSIFIYRSQSVDALSSCCRLRNAFETNTFSSTLGAGGIMTGSKGVITLNINRIVQDWYKTGVGTLTSYITPIVERVHKYLTAYNEIVWDCHRKGILTMYNAGYCDLDKKYLTIGVNGFLEGAEFLKINISPYSEEYIDYTQEILGTVGSLNKRDKTRHCMFNTEFVPAESLAVKNAKWDRQDGYWVPRDTYNSYFYPVEEEINVIDKLMFYGHDFTDCLDGGSANHINLDQHLTKDQYRIIMNNASKIGCPYFTFNIPNTVCNKCGHISKRYLKECPHCGSTDVDYLTRIIGYVKRISNFSEGRQKEAKKRYYGH